MNLTARRAATNADLDAMIGLRAESERWLHERRIQQWTDDYHDYARQVLRKSVTRGDAWVIEHDGTVIATVTLNGPDPDFWSWSDDTADALYLGKMIVARDHAGQGIGDAIMNWAGLRAARAGKRWVRLDCRRDNTGLHNYYLQRGFAHLQTVRPATRRTESGWLAQRPAGYLTATSVHVFDDAPVAGESRLRTGNPSVTSPAAPSTPLG